MRGGANKMSDIISPFMFNKEYFETNYGEPNKFSSTNQKRNYTATVSASSPSSLCCNVPSFVFPPVSVSIPQPDANANANITSIPHLDIPSSVSKMPEFHCENKAHDSLFVCFYVLYKKDAMLYYRDTRRWEILERQYKIQFAEILREPKNSEKLTHLFPKRGNNSSQIGKIDDELINERCKTISIKTFISLCCIHNINVVLIDHDTKAMCILTSTTDNDNHVPTTIIHITNEKASITWNTDADYLKQQTQDYSFVSPSATSFTQHLMEPSKSKGKGKGKNTATEKTQTLTITGLLKSINAYKMEQLQSMCEEYNINHSQIKGTGKGGKIIKADLYNSIQTHLDKITP